VGLEPLGVGPGDRREPLDEFGWLPLGETTGLEPLRPKSLMVVTATAAEGVLQVEGAVEESSCSSGNCGKARCRGVQRESTHLVRTSAVRVSVSGRRERRRLADP
jgi:hypothetical protein